MELLVVWQGGWEDDEDVYEAASREAMEEAGVKGTIDVSIPNPSSMPLLISLLDRQCCCWHHA